ncbi:MAG: hypothetical protein EOP04_01185 [Proteobacteria bacterium]|nr:MAG: hypothetical protein EOP04_01185 [Pseudomonadota bacterium]
MPQPFNLSIEMFMKERRLSAREKEIFLMMLDGNVEIDELSKLLKISDSTTRIHIKTINNKCGSKSRAEALVHFIKFLRKCYDSSQITIAD